MSKSYHRRHMLIPDTQLRPGVPTEHIGWAAEAIVEYMPDVVVVIGDWWDCPTAGTHSEPGSMEKEGSRILADIEIGNEQFKRLVAPMEAEIARRVKQHLPRWNPQREFCFGNHEFRLVRYVNANPALEGIISLDSLHTPGFNRNEFLKVVKIDGIWYCHYFANQKSGRNLGGSIDNRLNKIGNTFVAGHEQGLLYGIRQFPENLTRSGLVAGSFYLHDEEYRGVQCNGEWRGIVVLNEVDDGKYDIMPLSMNYLRRRFG